MSEQVQLTEAAAPRPSAPSTAGTRPARGARLGARPRRRPGRRGGLRGPRARAPPAPQRRRVAAARRLRSLRHRRGGRLGGRRGVASRSPRPASAVHISGRFAVHPQYGPKITVEAIRAAPPRASTRTTTSPTGPSVPVERLEADLRELLATIQNPQLRAAARPLLRPGLRRSGSASATRRRPSTTTRPTATGCSTTRSRSPRR